MALVYVFAKPPLPGACKSRLAVTLGAERAAKLAEAFLTDTLEHVHRAGFEARIATTAPHGPFPSGVPVEDQGGGTLGARLERILRRGLCHARVVVALGADSPGLPPDRLPWAVEAARRVGAALVPAEDGGFVALAVTRCPPGLLDGVPWSSAETALAVTGAFRAHGLALAIGEPWFDIDVEADLARFRAVVPTERAPVTWAVLEGR